MTTTYWVNNNRHASGYYEKMPTETTVSLNNGSRFYSPMLPETIIGSRLEINTPDGWRTYRKIAGGSFQRLWDFASGDYSLRYGDYSSYDGESEAYAWTSINRMLTKASGDAQINVKWSPEGYRLDYTDQLPEEIEPQVGGTILTNTTLCVEGYKISPGDMSLGGEHYQSPMIAFVNGIDATKKVTIDGVGAMANLLSLDGVDNIMFRNFRFTGSTGSIFTSTNIPMNVSFENCFFDDASFVCNATCERFKFSGCYVKDMSIADGNIFKLKGFGFLFDGCVVELTGSVVVGINIGLMTTGGSAYICNSLILNGAQAIHTKGFTDVRGNTICNSAVAAIVCSSSSDLSQADAFNNIIMPTAHDTGVAFLSGAAAGEGGSFNNDYNCIFSVDGQLLDNIGSAESGNTSPTIGANSVQADPMLTSNYRSRNPAVLRGGKPDLQGNAGQIGAVLSEHQFKSNAAMSNQGRMRIFR